MTATSAKPQQPAPAPEETPKDSTPNQFALLKESRFMPLFVTQFLGAFHDNLFKNALTVMVLFGVGFGAAEDRGFLVTVAAALFILPFALFSAMGGQLAERYAKDRVIRALKVFEIVIAAVASAGLLLGSIPLSLAALFMLGTQSALFSPSKYSILPQHLPARDLIGANALLNTGTFLAILVGSVAGALLVMVGAETDGTARPYLVCAVMGVCAAAGYVASRAIPAAPPQHAVQGRFDYNILGQTIGILRTVFDQKTPIIRAIFGVGWFYFLGSMFMTQLPAYTRDVLGAKESVLTLFMVLFSVGVGIGGLLNNRLLHGRVAATYVPLASIGMSLFAIDLYCASPIAAPQDALLTLSGFLHDVHAWRIILDITMIAVLGGLFVVPLNAVIQHYTHEDSRARVIAGAGIIDALFMVASAAMCAGLLKAGLPVEGLFLVFGLCNFAVAIFICALLPDALFKSLLQSVFKLLYRVEIRGIENVEKAGKRAVIVGNHVSFLDPPLLAAFLPGRPMFAINTQVAQRWWLRPFLRLVEAFPLDPTNPFSVKSLIKEVEKDRHCVIFPEGRLTTTGALMKIYDGPGMVADKTDAMILPVRLDGVQHTPFARLKGKVPLHRFPKITITFLEPRKFEIDPDIKGRKRRAAAARKLYDVMEDMIFITGDREKTLYQAMLDARFVNGGKAVIAEDIQRTPMPFNRLIRGSIGIGRYFAARTAPRENVGVLLPNSLAALVTFFALQGTGRVPAMLNFSAGEKAVRSACKTAQVKTVITSRVFIEKGRLEPLAEAIAQDAQIVYLEDVKKDIGICAKISALLISYCAASWHKRFKVGAQDPAVVLYTSGSEGEPKGVVLSHANLLSNIVQLSARVDFNREDIVFNALPMFHSFGLTGGTLLPVLSGVRSFMYPSPLHYRIVPELVYDTNATIMFGTDTFLNGYARMANPYDFYRMRYIFAGAEKVKDETRRLYMERFGVRVLEGYGATETSPAIAVNSPMHQKPGSVGRILPGMTYRLEPVEGVDEGGRLFVAGPNVMLGYYMADAPSVLKKPEGGWHDTGDIVTVDEDGYIKIQGRAKRFAKIAGEMVSLGVAEGIATGAYPQAAHAVVALPDAKKGEQLILLTTAKEAKKADLSAFAAQQKISELAVPKVIIVVDAVPVLGTGKTDYVTALAIAKKETGADKGAAGTEADTE